MRANRANDGIRLTGFGVAIVLVIIVAVVARFSTRVGVAAVPTSQAVAQQ